MIKIETLSLDIPSNRNVKSFKLEATVTIDEAFFNEFISKAIEDAKKKYQFANILPSTVKISFTKRSWENYLTACCEMCIGDGDYIRRVTTGELPAIIFNTTKEL